MHIASIVVASYLVSSARCSYSEDLWIKPLNRGNALASFKFEMSQPLDNTIIEYTSFPRSLGQIISKSDTKELHLRFGQGMWDARSWGSAPGNGSLTGGVGVELWAWVGGNSKEEAWKNWRQLVHSLGGYFCASINFIDEKVTTFPSDQIYRPRGQHFKRSWLMRGVLPAEPVCTENLTPFLKLLPCKSDAGIASLLDGHSLFRSKWQSMAVDVWHPDKNSISLRQIVSSVIDTERFSEDAQPWALPKEKLHCDETKPWSNDWTCYPVAPNETSYTLSQLFGRNISNRCALISHSVVEIEAPQNWLVDNDSKLRRIDLKDNFVSDLQLKTANSDAISGLLEPEIYVERSFSGWGQQGGGIRTVVTNPGGKPLTVSYFETFPWYMKIYLHTTKLRGEGKLRKQFYIPSKDRMRPTQLELAIELPAHSKLEVEYEFHKSLLFIEEYPPDANHGFEIPPGLMVVRNNEGNRIYEVRTSSLLLSLPVPDFSMPYNVIILTSTVMAMAFATIINLLTREVVAASDVSSTRGNAKTLKDKLMYLLGQ